MTTTLTVFLSAEYGCYVAYEGNTPEESRAIGEGRTREDAVADYWFCIHGDNAATLLEPMHTDGYCWKLQDMHGFYQTFDTRDEAIAYAEANQYVTSPLVKKV